MHLATTAEIPRGDRSSIRESLRHAIEHTAHLLPAQGPIKVFIHHNTLHAFEHLSFEEGVETGAKVFSCQPYFPENRFRELLGRGRIRHDDLRAVLQAHLKSERDQRVAGLVSRMDLQMSMLINPIWNGPVAELEFLIAESEALETFLPETSGAARGAFVAETRRWVMRDLSGRPGSSLPTWAESILGESPRLPLEEWSDKDWQAYCLRSMWQIISQGVKSAPLPAIEPRPEIRHRDFLLAATGVDVDLGVNDLLIRFYAAFVDQGIANWPLPNRKHGLFRSFLEMYSATLGPPLPWQKALRREARKLLSAGADPLDSILDSLDQLGVGKAEWDAYLSAVHLALRGWGGILYQMEQRGDRVAHAVPQGSMLDYVAMRLLLDRLAISQAAKSELNYRGPLNRLREYLSRVLVSRRTNGVAQRAYPIFQLAQWFGWDPKRLSQLHAAEWSELVKEVESFTEIKRRRMFFLAYERQFRIQTLDAIALHSRHVLPPEDRPRFQVVTCLDEREESFRRHIEEVAPDVETYGAPGFFSVAMYYRGIADAHFVPLCPVIVRPQHWVTETVVENLEKTNERRRKARQAFGKASHRIHVGSRTFALGAILTATFGVLASIPLVIRTLFPRLTARTRLTLRRIILAPPPTRLQLEQCDPSQSDEKGYTVEEMTNLAERILKDFGFTKSFARLVLTIGHGSSSLNNPHKSAYDCGACGGSRGGPNGRAIAQVLNDPRVRAGLKSRGIQIPEDTVFVGGMHNTSNDEVTFSDLDLLPESHQAEFVVARGLIDQAAERNAHERCRRFETSPLSQSLKGARLHVEGRSEDLSQVRPELGHATNAICYVGRRERTRGLFLDRRAFLTSYDPTQDTPNGAALGRILGAAVPVCGGISLEYYFSRVDSKGYGCGTKLPHNVTGLLGVMDGAASDLRTGLPWQMVEVHEPMRLLFIIESTPQTLLEVMKGNAEVERMIANHWVQTTLLDPHSQEIKIYANGKFETYQPNASRLPTAVSSIDWYRGWRDHLEFAEIVQPS